MLFRIVSEYTAITGIVLIVILSLISINSKKPNPKFNTILAHCTYYFTGVLFLPVCGSLICVWESGVSRTGIWYLHGIASMVFLLLLLVYSVFVTIIKKEREFNNSVGYCKHAIFPDIIIVCLKAVYAVVYVMAVLGNAYLNGAISCIMLGIVLNYQTRNYYYHNDMLSSLYIYTLSLLFFVSLLGIYSYLIDLSNTFIILVLIFIASVIVTWAINRSRDTYIYTKLEDIFKMKNKNVDEHQIVLKYLQRINSNYSVCRKNIIQYIGLNHIHSSTCINPACPLKSLFDACHLKESFITDIDQLNYPFLTMLNTMYQNANKLYYLI
jgi:hypothetical protein